MNTKIRKQIFILVSMLIPSLVMAASFSQASLFHRLVTSKQFPIECRTANDDKRITIPHRLPAIITDSVMATYDVQTERLTIRFSYKSENTFTYLYKDTKLLLADWRHTKAGDHIVWNLNELGDGSYLVVVENRDNGMLLYGIVPNDPRFVLRSTYEFSKHAILPHAPANDSLPSLSYSAAIAYEVYPTFNKPIVSTGSIQVGVESGDADCMVYLFDKTNPDSFSQTFTTSVAPGDSVSRGSMTYAAPAGTYMLVVTAADSASNYKKCKVTVNGTTYNNQWLAYNRFPFTITPENSQTVYDSFVRGWHCYPQLLMLGNSGTVVGYKECQDNSYVNGWSSNIHLQQTYSAATTGALVIPREEAPQPYPMASLPLELASIYVGCKKIDSNGRDRKYFEQTYLADSVFFSSTVQDDCYSWSWAYGDWMLSEDPTRLFAQDYISNNVTDIERFDSLFAKVGFTRTSATYANSAIDLYQKSGNRNKWHAAIKAYSQPYALGFGWESKMDKGCRYFHPRHAIKSSNYDTTHYFWKMSYNEALPMNTNIPPEGFISFDANDFVVENEELNDDYFEQMWIHIWDMDVWDTCDFDDYIEAAQDVLESDTLSSFDAFLQSSEYNTLLTFCQSYPEMMYYAFLYVAEGNATAITLIEDAYAQDYPGILQQVWTYNRTHKRNANNKGILRTRHANAVLFIKYLLDEEMNRSNNPAQRELPDVSYSDDPRAFGVSANGQTLTVTYNLPNDANVSLCVATPYGQYVSRLHNNDLMAAGSYSEQVSLPNAGMYIVSYVVNGRIYDRKITVK